jgi:hypothetical protein
VCLSAARRLQLSDRFCFGHASNMPIDRVPSSLDGVVRSIDRVKIGERPPWTKGSTGAIQGSSQAPG